MERVNDIQAENKVYDRLSHFRDWNDKIQSKENLRYIRISFSVSFSVMFSLHSLLISRLMASINNVFDHNTK